MENLLKLIIKNLVDDEDSVEITEKTNDDSSILYEVKVSKNDMGKVIGKQGRMAKSIRNVIRAIATKEHKKVSIEFVG